MTSLISDKQRTVELFIDNLLWGRVKAEFFRYFDHRPEKEAGAFVEDMYIYVSRWRRYKSGEDREFVSESDFDDATEKLYDTYVNARIDGMITGELIDEKHEAAVRKLKQEIEECKRTSKEQEERIASLREHNIILANELEDRKNIIEEYEKAAGYKKDGES